MKWIFVSIPNIGEFREAIHGEQCINGSYTEEELMQRLNRNIKSSIEDFGEEDFESIISSFLLRVAKNCDKVYFLDVSRVVHREYSIVVHLIFNGFVK